MSTKLFFSFLICSLAVIIFVSCGGSDDDGPLDLNIVDPNLAPTAGINAPAEGNTFIFGEEIQFAGSSNDSEDGDLTGSALVWSSDVNGQIGTGKTCTSSTLSAGTHQIILSATDSEGLVGSDTVTITIKEASENNSPVTQITTPVEGNHYMVAEEIQFAGSCNDNENGDLVGEALVWSSDASGQIGTGKTCTSSSLPTGIHHITLTCIDASGAEGMDTVVITVSTSRLPDTGQTTSYTDTFGEDSDYTINPPSYTKLDAFGNDMDAGVTEWAMIRDEVTGLIWEVKTDDGGIHDKDNTYTWQDGQDIFIAQLNSDSFGGYSDWRIPNVKELYSLIHKDYRVPAININYFPHTEPHAYWSSTSYAGDTANAFWVSFNQGVVTGRDNLKSAVHFVRAVRSGQ